VRKSSRLCENSVGYNMTTNLAIGWLSEGTIYPRLNAKVL
jgi:hypothetical protein